MRMIVQIYEIQTAEEAQRCLELGVDHIGSVLLSESAWRRPELREVVRLSAGTTAKNSMIPLFSELEVISRALDYYQPHFVHFCDNLTDPGGRAKHLADLVTLQKGIKERFPEIGIMRTLPLPPKGTLPRFPILQLATALEPYSDVFLTDTWLGQEPVEGFVGITGRVCDWERARKLVSQCRIPVILAGGLGPENVYKALLAVAPAGADSCTRTNQVDNQGESLRFRKAFDRVKTFVGEVRRAERAIRQQAL
jgi:phosphoribosylanthranilate isomerase